MKIDVLVPTYKPHADHLTTALERLLAQTETEWRCTVCDEPTEVDTAGILAPYADDPRIRYVRNPQRLGIGGNWNRCFSLSEAPVIAYMFQDDLWEPDYLETGCKIFDAHPSVGFVSMNHTYRYDDDLWTVEGYEQLQRIKRDVLRHGPYAGRAFLREWLERDMHPNLIGEPPFVLLRRSVMETVGPFNEEMPQFLDVEYWLRCLLVTDWYFEEPMHGAFRVHGDAASFQNNDSGTGLYDRIECFEMLIDRLRGDALHEVAVASRNRALQDMAKKFLLRLRRKQAVAVHGSGKLVSFALRNPFALARALCIVLWKRLWTRPKTP